MIPRNEHPNPGFYREGYINLNGQWDFEFDFGKSGIAREFYAPEYAFSQKINVPFCPESVLSGIGNVDFMNAVWYKKKITLPEEYKGKRIIFHIGACDWQTTVFVNGKTALKHYQKYMEPSIGRKAVCLPSTSPANAAWSLERLVEAWECIRNINRQG
jgi:beta-galactosidase/beta-glucuronidase